VSSFANDPRPVLEAFEGLPLSVAVVDRRGLIIRVNREWDRFAMNNGGDRTSCGVGADYFAVCPSSDQIAARFAEGLRDVLAGGEPEFELEYPCHSPDEQRWFVARAAPLFDESGCSIGGAIITHLNITARRLAEDAVRSYALRLEQVNHDLEDFAHRIAHDLKEPLRSISYQTHTLAIADPALPAAAMEKIAAIERLAQRGIIMAEGLLRYAQLGLHEVQLVRTPLDTPVRDAIEALAGFLHGEDAVINIEGPLPALMIEPSLFTEAISNLIVNGIRHNDSRPRRIDIGPIEEPSRQGLYIRDNGAGIPAADHERIFEPFQRAGTARPGSGIGLALVKRIIELHNGEIRLESAPGCGTTVRVTLGV
jgi:signal transduction histidine kinase